MRLKVINLKGQKTPLGQRTLGTFILLECELYLLKGGVFFFKFYALQPDSLASSQEPGHSPLLRPVPGHLDPEYQRKYKCKRFSNSVWRRVFV